MVRGFSGFERDPVGQHQFAGKAVGVGGGDTDINHRSGKALRRVYRHRLHIGASAHQLAGPLAGAVEQNRHGAADGGFVEGDLLGVEQLLQRRQPFGLTASGTWAPSRPAAGVPGRALYLKE